nr:UDP-glucuronic acid decarboxylase family protein [uncultured Methanoregula sp.]
MAIQEDVDSIVQNIDSTPFADKTILITGGAGFLGSLICEVLIKIGGNVICVDNFASGREQNLIHIRNNKHFHLITQDVSEELELHEPVHYVFHLASRASPFEFEKYPIQILKSNTIGTLNALELARKNNAKFLFTSTSEIYGQSTIFPTPESYWGNVNTIGIRGCYDEAKRAGEALCMAYLRQYNVNVRIARIFNTYGPKMRGDGIYGRVIPRFLSQAMKNEPISIFGDGSQTRSFCYVTDQIEGLLKFISADDACRGEVINIGNPEEHTVMELAHMIKTMTHSSSTFEFHPLPNDDPLKRYPDITKATRLLDWVPKISLQTGLDKMLKEFKE